MRRIDHEQNKKNTKLFCFKKLKAFKCKKVNVNQQKMLRINNKLLPIATLLFIDV